MSLFSVDFPDNTIGLIDSRVNADLSQIPVSVRMLDEVGTLLTSPYNAGSVLRFGTGGISDDLSIGDAVYIEFPEGTNTAYSNGTYTVTHVFIGAFTDLEFDSITYVEDVSNVETYYSGHRPVSIEINLVDADDLNLNTIIPNPIPYDLDSTGRAFVDLSGILYGLLESNRYTNYRIDVKPIYDESKDSISNVSSNFILGLQSSIKQIGDLGGSNMWEYIMSYKDEKEVISASGSVGFGQTKFHLQPDNKVFKGQYLVGGFIEVDAPPYKGTYKVLSNKSVVGEKYIELEVPFTSNLSRVYPNSGTVQGGSGRMLTETCHLKAWLGWSRFCSYVVDHNIQARTGTNWIDVKSTELDVNKNFIGNVGGLSNLSILPKVYDFKIPTRSNENTKYSEVVILDQDGTYLTSPQFFEWQNDCTNGIMIDWLNRAGGFEQHLFTINQGVQMKVDQGTIYEHRINNRLNTAVSNINRTVNKRTQTINLKAEKLTPEYYNSLASLVESSVVNVWMNKEGTKKVGVIVKNGLQQSYQTGSGSIDFNVTLQFPPNFNFFK